MPAHVTMTTEIAMDNEIVPQLPPATNATDAAAPVMSQHASSSNNNYGALLMRVSSLPVVSSAVGRLSGMYENTKQSNEYVKRTLESMESSVKNAAQKAMPLIHVVEPTLKEIDSFGCRQLDRLEESLPVIRKPTDELFADGKRLVDGAKSHLEQIRESNERRVKDAVRTVVDGQVKPRIEYVLSTTECAVDRYLPVSSEQQQAQTDQHDQQASDKSAASFSTSSAHATDDSPAEGEREQKETAARVKALSHTLQQRILERVMHQLERAQAHSVNSPPLKITLDLVQLAQNNIRTSITRSNQVVRDSLSKSKEQVATMRQDGLVVTASKARSQLTEASSHLLNSVRTSASETCTRAVNKVNSTVSTRVMPPIITLASLPSSMYANISHVSIAQLQSRLADLQQQLQAYANTPSLRESITHLQETLHVAQLQEKLSQQRDNLGRLQLQLLASIEIVQAQLSNIKLPASLQRHVDPVTASLKSLYTRLQNQASHFASLVKQQQQEMEHGQEAAESSSELQEVELKRLAKLVANGLNVLRGFTNSVVSHLPGSFSSSFANSFHATSPNHDSSVTEMKDIDSAPAEFSDAQERLSEEDYDEEYEDESTENVEEEEEEEEIQEDE